MNINILFIDLIIILNKLAKLLLLFFEISSWYLENYSKYVFLDSFNILTEF